MTNENDNNTVFLLVEFDRGTFRKFTPDPAGFRTEDEAKRFLELHDWENSVFYTYFKARHGRY